MWMGIMRLSWRLIGEDERMEPVEGPGPAADEPEPDDPELELDYTSEPLLPSSGLTIIPRLGPFP